MKLTSVAYSQHIGRMFKKHWRIQKKRTPFLTKAEEILLKNGISVYSPEEILEEKREFVK